MSCMVDFLKISQQNSILKALSRPFAGLPQRARQTTAAPGSLSG